MDYFVPLTIHKMLRWRYEGVILISSGSAYHDNGNGRNFADIA